MQPSQSSFDRPTRSTQSAAAFDEHWLDTASNRLQIIRPVALDDVGALTGPPWLTTDRRNRVDPRQQLRDIVGVGTGQYHRQRNPPGIGGHVMFCYRICGDRSDSYRVLLPSDRPLSMALSTKTLDQLILSVRCNLLSGRRCSWSQTLAERQAVSRGQQARPQSQPISCGRSSQAIPFLSTKGIPVRAFRLPIGERPPWGECFSGGSNGSTSSHNYSVSKGLAISVPLDILAHLTQKRSS